MVDVNYPAGQASLPQEEVQVPETSAQYVAEMERQVGEEAGTLHVEKDVMAFLEHMQEGVIVQLHIEGPRRFRTRIELEDIGLAPREEKGKKSEKSALSDKALRLLENYAQLGSLFLLPRSDQLDDLANNGKLSDEQRSQLVTYDELVSLERRARYNLERFSLETQWGAFVPVTAYEAWKKANEEYETLFNKHKEKLIANYDTIIEHVLEAYRVIAEELWRHVITGTFLNKADTPTKEHFAELIEQLTKGDGKGKFVDNYLDCIRAAMKSREVVEKGLKYSFERSVIPLPSLLAEDVEKTQRIFRDRVINEAKAKAELDRIAEEHRTELERIEAERRIERAREWSEETKANETRQLYLQAEREKIQQEMKEHEKQLLANRKRVEQQEKMELDVITEARDDKMQLLRKFRSDVVGQINYYLQQVCGSVLESIERNDDTLRGPCSQQLRDLIEKVEALNFMENTAIEDMRRQIKDVLPTDAEKTDAKKGVAKIDTTRLQSVLREVRDEAAAVCSELDFSPSTRKKRAEDAPPEDSETANFERRGRRKSVQFAEEQGERTPRRRRANVEVSYIV